VGKIEVYISQEVVNYLDNLVYILYKDEYFGFIESAEAYVIKIYDFISESIYIQLHKPTPKELLKLGNNYIFYKANSITTWYIFFESNENRFLVTGIINNHCQEAKWLI